MSSFIGANTTFSFFFLPGRYLYFPAFSLISPRWVKSQWCSDCERSTSQEERVENWTSCSRERCRRGACCVHFFFCFCFFFLLCACVCVCFGWNLFLQLLLRPKSALWLLKPCLSKERAGKKENAGGASSRAGMWFCALALYQKAKTQNQMQKLLNRHEVFFFIISSNLF